MKSVDWFWLALAGVTGLAWLGSVAYWAGVFG